MTKWPEGCLKGGGRGGGWLQVRLQVRRLGVKGLDVGFGCGIGLGYGIGLGIMLRPGVLDQLSRDAQTKLGMFFPAPRHEPTRAVNRGECVPTCFKSGVKSMSNKQTSMS